MNLKDYEYYSTDLGTLYCGDCLEIMPMLPKVDLVLTDPPYGLGAIMKGGTWGAQTHNEGFLKWDINTNQTWVNEILLLKIPTIIWGGNYYHVPPSRCWLVWLKKNPVPTMADFEMAYTNFDMPSKKIALPVGRVEYGHPTQKPTALFLWCLSKKQGSVLDPFAGSGTTAVACERLKRRWICIEISEEYCAIAKRRIELERQQLKMF